MRRHMSSDLMAIVGGLHFQEDRSELIRRIDPAKWPELLRLTDEAQLTLPLAIRYARSLPAEVRARVEKNMARNAERYLRIGEVYDETAQALTSRGIEFIVLKGMTHWPFYCDALSQRPQFDLDLYCPAQSIHAAVEAITGLGYEPVHHIGGISVDHLPSLIRKTGWRWRGDYYDPDMPLTIELHFRFWNADHEHFPVCGADRFRDRKTNRIAEGRRIPALHPQDDLAYTTWHLVRHLVRGNLRLYHVYELAHFLDRTASADAFWQEWRGAPEGRVAEPIAFRLAVEWFGCRANPAVLEEIDRLPRNVDRWFRMFAFSPVLAMELPNKDELFLHLALARGTVNRFRIAVRRILPVHPPRVVLDAHVAGKSIGLAVRRFAFLGIFLIRRAVRHLRALGPVIQSGFRWWRAAWRPL